GRRRGQRALPTGRKTPGRRSTRPSPTPANLPFLAVVRKIKRRAFEAVFQVLDSVLGFAWVQWIINERRPPLFLEYVKNLGLVARTIMAEVFQFLAACPNFPLFIPNGHRALQGKEIDFSVGGV